MDSRPQEGGGGAEKKKQGKKKNKKSGRVPSLGSRKFMSQNATKSI